MGVGARGPGGRRRRRARCRAAIAALADVVRALVLDGLLTGLHVDVGDGGLALALGELAVALERWGSR